VRYVPRLDRALVEEATRHTLRFWALGKTQEEHTAHNVAQLANAGPEVLRYVGLVDDGGALLASIKRYTLLLRAPDGAVLRTAGIGAVFTPEAGRGRGAASALLRAVLDEARDLGYGAALLYSDIAPAFYARFGFTELPAVDHMAPAAALPEQGGLSLRPAGTDDLDRLLAWHEATWPQGWLRPLRSRALWRYFRWRNRLTEWILADGHHDVGYLVAGPDDPQRDLPEPRSATTLWVDEWAAPGVDAARVWATVRRLAEREGRTSVGAWLRPDGVPAAFTAARRPEAIPMVAFLDGDARAHLPTPPASAFIGSFEHF
jgi:predicted N-acetyltransferase YhbS